MAEDAELSALLRATLRAHTPAGLSETQHAALLVAARAQRPLVRRVARGAALLAAACVLPLAVYWGISEDEQPVPAHTEQPERTNLAAEREAAFEAARAAEAAAREALLREEKAAAEARAARSFAAERAAAAAASAGRDATEHLRHKAGKSKKRAAKAGRGAEQKAIAKGACDQGDPLCGL